MRWIRTSATLLLLILCIPLHGQYRSQINAGLYQTDPHRDSVGRVSELRSRFGEQQLQTGLGLTFAKCYNAFNLGGGIREVSYRDGTAVIETNGNWTAFTMSNYIIGGKGLENDVSNKTYQHEYGHYLQSQDLGRYYVMLIAIPSIMSKVIYRENHHFSPTEQDANRRGFDYFTRYYPGEFTWDHESNPVPDPGFNYISPTRFDKVIFGLNPIIGTLVGGIAHGARKNQNN
ncbi:MAG: hypothetical protein J5769_04210 [Bacteroidales bacterium]|nr:hypothetical protein [Bacteroidales bacterium]